MIKILLLIIWIIMGILAVPFIAAMVAIRHAAEEQARAFV